MAFDVKNGYKFRKYGMNLPLYDEYQTELRWISTPVQNIDWIVECRHDDWMKLLAGILDFFLVLNICFVILRSLLVSVPFSFAPSSSLRIDWWRSELTSILHDRVIVAHATGRCVLREYLLHLAIRTERVYDECFISARLKFRRNSCVFVGLGVVRLSAE